MSEIIDDMFGKDSPSEPSVFVKLASHVDQPFNRSAFRASYEQYMDKIGLNPNSCNYDNPFPRIETELHNTLVTAAMSVLFAIYIPLLVGLLIVLIVLAWKSIIPLSVGFCIFFLLLVLLLIYAKLFGNSLGGYLEQQKTVINNLAVSGFNRLVTRSPEALLCSIDTYINNL